ncbi:hypothetical protein VTK56DRAFT_1016 [Thermocarpiscus australiensis]
MHSYPPSRRQEYGFDPYVCEYALSPAFWILGLFIIAFWIATVRSYRDARRKHHGADEAVESAPTSSGSADPKEEKEAAGTTTTLQTARSRNQPPPGQRGRIPPCFTLRLMPYLTTKPRKAVALAVYLAILGAQLLEGYWVLATLGRATEKLFDDWVQIAGAGRWFGAAFFTPVVAWMALMDALAACCAGLIVSLQLSCIIELCFSTGGMWPVRERAGPVRQESLSVIWAALLAHRQVLSTILEVL